MSDAADQLPGIAVARPGIDFCPFSPAHTEAPPFRSVHGDEIVQRRRAVPPVDRPEIELDLTVHITRRRTRLCGDDE